MLRSLQHGKRVVQFTTKIETLCLRCQIRLQHSAVDASDHDEVENIRPPLPTQDSRFKQFEFMKARRPRPESADDLSLTSSQIVNGDSDRSRYHSVNGETQARRHTLRGRTYVQREKGYTPSRLPRVVSESRMPFPRKAVEIAPEDLEKVGKVATVCEVFLSIRLLVCVL